MMCIAGKCKILLQSLFTFQKGWNSGNIFTLGFIYGDWSSEIHFKVWKCLEK